MFIWPTSQPGTAGQGCSRYPQLPKGSSPEQAAWTIIKFVEELRMKPQKFEFLWLILPGLFIAFVSWFLTRIHQRYRNILDIFYENIWAQLKTYFKFTRSSRFSVVLPVALVHSTLQEVKRGGAGDWCWSPSLSWCWQRRTHSSPWDLSENINKECKYARVWSVCKEASENIQNAPSAPQL